MGFLVQNALTFLSLSLTPEVPSWKSFGEHSNILFDGALDQEPISGLEIDMDLYTSTLKKVSGNEVIRGEGDSYLLKDRYHDASKKVVRDFLKQEFEALSFSVTQQKYQTGVNFVAKKQGRSDQTLIISAHIDTIGNAGANDNGSGIAATLAIAKALKESQFYHNLQIVIFDEEENHMLGSKYFVEQAYENQNIDSLMAVFQIDMIGTNTKGDGKFHVIDCGNKHSIPYALKIMDAVNELELPLQRMASCSRRSDHEIFWQYGVPALLISENLFMGGRDLCYHKACDVFDERIDFEYIKNITTAIAYASAKVLRPL